MRCDIENNKMDGGDRPWYKAMNRNLSEQQATHTIYQTTLQQQLRVQETARQES